MKKFFTKYKLICFIILLSVFLIILGILLFSKSPKQENTPPSKEKKTASYKENYVYDNNIYRDATVVSNEALTKEHCLDEVCIKDLTIYQGTYYNNVVLKIVNKTTKTKTGQLALVFGDRVLFVSYKNLKEGDTTNYTVELGDKMISDSSDFTVRYLTDDEKKGFHTS